MNDLGRRLDIVDASAIPVVRASKQYSQPLFLAKALADGAAELVRGAPVLNGRVTAQAVQRNHGRSPAVLVRKFTEPPMPSPSMLAKSVLLISTDSTKSDPMVSSLIWRTPLSGDGTLTPSMVTLL